MIQITLITIAASERENHHFFFGGGGWVGSFIGLYYITTLYMINSLDYHHLWASSVP